MFPLKMCYLTISSLKSHMHKIKYYQYLVSRYRTKSSSVDPEANKFETVFSFPTIKYIALINRLKVYQLIGTSVALPSCGILEVVNIIPEHTFFSTTYVGLTAAAVLSLVTLPFQNIIGFLYISEDNKFIKISSVDYWGKRKDRIIKSDDWLPLLEMPPKTMDALYLSPKLTDGTKYKLFIRFGKILNSRKIGQVLE